MNTKAKDELAAIEEVVMRYIDGIAQSDPDLLASAFHPQATMTGFFGPDLDVVPEAGRSIAAYMRTIEPTSVHSPKYRGRILSVDQSSDTAAVAIAEDQLQGHDMKSFFHLHKVNGKWLILSKATTVV